jgi:hypothetical protein
VFQHRVTVHFQGTRRVATHEAESGFHGEIGQQILSLRFKPIDPDEVEFMLAMERYMREQRRPFPRSHEVLAVVKSLGYRKLQAEA